MPLQHHAKSTVLETLALLKDKTAAKDRDVMEGITRASGQIDVAIKDPQNYLVGELERAIAFVGNEVHHDGEDFHSRNPLAALSQAHLSADWNGVTHNSIGDVFPSGFNAYGEENPIVWDPLMVNILLEHVRSKAAFRKASEANSFIPIPQTCSIALLGDWGADNHHAQSIAKLVRARGVDIVVHLGDIYYAGTRYECQRFLDNWPIPVRANNSFALNGNHEMYSRGIPYFEVVLPAFGQEASYFTLYNDHWQLHGLDTAYVPFSIDGTVETEDRPSVWKRMMDQLESTLPFVDHEHFDRKPDARLLDQWHWLQSKVAGSGSRKNILLSHNQPISAYLPEFEAGAFLYNEFWKLRETIPGGANVILAWFFGHEHKGTVYDDRSTEFKARLIGNGAIPHSRQALTPPAKDETGTSCTKVLTMNDKALRPDLLGVEELDLAVSSFALLTLDGPDAYVEYINEDGSLFLKEKLSGAPNDIVELGKGYKLLE